MKFFVTIQHPAHVHFFRHAISELKADGHDVSVFIRGVELAADLLERYGIDFERLAPASDSLPSLAKSQLQYEIALFRRARRADPDVLLAIGEPAITHVSAVLDCRSVLFTDTEHATLQNWISFPFADTICTPTCYELVLGNKQETYRGYHELAYLHPDRFDPDPSILKEIKATINERLVILRLVAWEALHDVGGSGFQNVRDIIEELEHHGARVLLTSEKDLPSDLEPYRTTVPPDRIHHLLFYADLFIGEGATMAAEAAVLGTPAVFVSSLSLGYLNELEREYGLVYTVAADEPKVAAVETASSILSDYEDINWANKREQLLNACVNTTNVILSQAKSPVNDRPTPATAPETSVFEP